MARRLKNWMGLLLRGDSFRYTAIFALFAMATGGQVFAESTATPAPEPNAQPTSASPLLRLLVQAARDHIAVRDRMFALKSGYVTFGRYGEMFLEDEAHCQSFGGSYVCVVPEAGELHIVEVVDIELRTYVIVGADLIARPTPQCDPAWAAQFGEPRWPYVDAAGAPVMPKGINVILPKKYPKRVMKAWEKRKPESLVGTLFIDSTGILRGLCTLEPFPNVLWVVRTESGGLELIHSGPEREGIYATVALDRTVEFVDAEAKAKVPDNARTTWHVVEQSTKFPTMYACSWSGPDPGVSRREVRIQEDGSRMTVPWTVR